MALGLSLLLPASSSAQSDDELDTAADELDPTGREVEREANEAAEASEDDEELGDDQFLSASELSEEQLDGRLSTIDAYLADMQRPARLYWYGWLTAGVVLTGGQALLAYEADTKAERAGFIVRASLSGANLLMLLINPYPARYASGRYRKLPTGTREQKELKLAAGEGWLISQAKADALATSWPAHVLGAVASVGAGVALAAAFDHNLKDAVTTTIGVFAISQLQVLSRPRRAMAYSKSYSQNPSSPELAVAPMIDRYAQGVSLVGQF